MRVIQAIEATSVGGGYTDQQFLMFQQRLTAIRNNINGSQADLCGFFTRDNIDQYVGQGAYSATSAAIGYKGADGILGALTGLLSSSVSDEDATSMFSRLGAPERGVIVDLGRAMLEAGGQPCPAEDNINPYVRELVDYMKNFGMDSGPSSGPAFGVN